MLPRVSPGHNTHTGPDRRDRHRSAASLVPISLSARVCVHVMATVSNDRHGVSLRTSAYRDYNIIRRILWIHVRDTDGLLTGSMACLARAGSRGHTHGGQRARATCLPRPRHWLQRAPAGAARGQRAQSRHLSRLVRQRPQPQEMKKRKSSQAHQQTQHPTTSTGVTIALLEILAGGSCTIFSTCHGRHD